MTFILLIKTLRKSLGFLFIACLSFVVIDEFWAEDFKAIYPGCVKAANVLDRLCMSYISAFVFYFLVVHYKAQKDKLIIYGYVIQRIDSIIGDCQETFRALADNALVKLQGVYPTDDEISIVCSKVTPSSVGPIVDINGVAGKWTDYLFFRVNRSKNTFERVFKKMTFLDADLVKALADIEDCSYFNQVELYKSGLTASNADFGYLKKSFTQYRNLIQTLDSYSQKKLDKYRSQ